VFTDSNIKGAADKTFKIYLSVEEPKQVRTKEKALKAQSF
jgi:hypothetical protein